MNKTKLELMLRCAKENFVSLSGVHYNPLQGWSQACVIKDKSDREAAIFYLGQIAILNKLLGNYQAVVTPEFLKAHRINL